MAASHGPSTRRRQGGIALLTALLLMLAILMTCVAAARTALSGARAAGHERDRMLALQAAMAALADAERDIEGGLDPSSARAAALAGAGAASAAAFAPGCEGGAPYEGLCAQAAHSGEILAALADESGPALALGSFTGAAMPALAAQAPRYLIERLPSAPDTLLYRISALGFGEADTTQVALQAYYRKLLAAAPAPAGGTDGAGGADGGEEGPAGAAPAPTAVPGSPGGPGLRVGWREIANWQDLAAAGG